MDCLHRPAGSACDVERLSGRLRVLERDVIHDISSLLSGVGLALDTLDPAALDVLHSDDREAIALAHGNAQWMRLLVEHYVAISQFTARHGEIVAQPFDVGRMLQDASSAAGEGPWDIDCPASVPQARGDRALMIQAVAVLVRSAMPLPTADVAPPDIRVTVRPGSKDIETRVFIAPRAGWSPRERPSARAFSVVRRFFTSSIEEQGGTAYISEALADGDLITFTLPSC